MDRKTQHPKSKAAERTSPPITADALVLHYIVRSSTPCSGVTVHDQLLAARVRLTMAKIYPQLRQLHENHFIEMRRTEGRAVLYSATPAGRKRDAENDALIKRLWS